MSDAPHRHPKKHRHHHRRKHKKHDVATNDDDVAVAKQSTARIPSDEPPPAYASESFYHSTPLASTTSTTSTSSYDSTKQHGGEPNRVRTTPGRDKPDKSHSPSTAAYELAAVAAVAGTMCKWHVTKANNFPILRLFLSDLSSPRPTTASGDDVARRQRGKWLLLQLRALCLLRHQRVP